MTKTIAAAFVGDVILLLEAKERKWVIRGRGVPHTGQERKV